MIQGTIISSETDNANDYYAEPTPIVEPTVNPAQEQESAEDFTKQFSDMFNAFAESIPQNSHEAKSSKNFFKKFSDYIGSKKFEDDLNEKSEKYHVPKKQIAKNFFLKVLGIIGDILGIVVNTACSIIDTAISLLATLLHGAVSVISKAGNAIVSVVTCNQTNIATA